MKKDYYINNERFEDLIQLYIEEPKIYEEELMEMFGLLITNIINSFNFRVDVDDAVQDCYLLILKTLKNYKRSQGTAFNYFTTIIVNNLKLIYTKNKKYQENIRKYGDYMVKKDLDP